MTKFKKKVCLPLLSLGVILFGCGQQVIIASLIDGGETDPDGSDTDTGTGSTTDAGPPTACVWGEIFDTFQPMRGVWGSSLRDVYAVGGDTTSGGLILKYRPLIGDWTNLSPEETSDIQMPDNFFDVWGAPPVSDQLGSNNVVFVYQNGVLRFNGIGAWQTELGVGSPLDNTSLRGIWGTANDNIYVVGRSIPVPPIVEAKVAHYDGVDWQWSSIPTTSSMLNAVWTQSSEDAFAVSEVGTVIRYNGDSWEPVMSAKFGDAMHFRAVWGRSTDDVFVVGQYYFLSGSAHAMIMHWNGEDWLELDLMGVADAEPASNVGLNGIWGDPETRDVYAVGFIERKPNSGTYNALILHYDDSQWSRIDAGIPFQLNDIWGDGNGNLFVVGTRGLTACLM